jgi:hypothetical protein
MRKIVTHKFPLAAIAALAVVACGDNSTTTGTPSASADSFVLTEWSVTAPTNPVHAGSVEVTASNRGHETHELVIVHISSAAALPTKPDGSIDEDKIAESDKVGEIADIAAGKTITKAFNLPVGNYVALCNIVDQMGMGNSSTGNSSMSNGGMGNGGMGGTGNVHVHFVLGMSTPFTVT